MTGFVSRGLTPEERELVGLARDRIRTGGWVVVVLQFVLAVLCAVQVSWYVGRSMPDPGRVNLVVALLGGLAWYLMALALPLAMLLGLTGGALLAWRLPRLSRALARLLVAGTLLCTAVVVLGMTPFGRAMHTWWLD
ncbi:hypothetical protein [Micromonospora zhanjiangensis]|uniref:Uncharacterized protein n=1 Tax=Micromonospora zhanjiangensis TaxID=1522057 RepID=A0ABV8KUY8_9ACTN